jgi:ribosomal protein S18 acetylase RimI-like enzyme
MGNIRIRLASESDIAWLLHLELSTFNADSFSKGQIKYLVTRAKSTVLIARQSGTPLAAAYMLWRKNSRLGRLYSIAVAPTARGLGIGALLLNECERQATAKGRVGIYLEVRADNLSAISLYRKHGYGIFRELPEYYGDGTDGLKMLKMLTPGP